MKRFEFMIRGAMTALAALGLLAICPAVNAQSVVLTVNPNSATANGVQLCASPPVLGMDPSGGLTVSCTPANSGGGTTAPSCTVPNVSATILTGATTIASATIGAVCSGNPSPSYAWTNIDAAAGFTNPATASVSVGPLAAGSYHFSVIATNSAGSSPSAQGILTINPAPTGNTNCPSGPINGTFSANAGEDVPAIPANGYASYMLPTFPAVVRKYFKFMAAQSTSSFTGLPVEYTVSKCVGDFTAMPAACAKFGIADSGITLYAFQGTTADSAGSCVMDPNTQYYLNVRNVHPDGSNACTTGTCYLDVQMHNYTY